MPWKDAVRYRRLHSIKWLSPTPSKKQESQFFTSRGGRRSLRNITEKSMGKLLFIYEFSKILDSIYIGA